MLFDCIALFIGLCASYISKMERNKSYTFGYERMETLSGFFNAVFLIMIALMIIVDSIIRVFDPVVINSDGLLLVSFLGLVVNMIGLVFFHDHHHHGGTQ
jgi:zinc transporter 5/7